MKSLGSDNNHYLKIDHMSMSNFCCTFGQPYELIVSTGHIIWHKILTVENFDRENIDELLEIHQICQIFSPNKILRHMVLDNICILGHYGSHMKVVNM